MSWKYLCSGLGGIPGEAGAASEPRHHCRHHDYQRAQLDEESCEAQILRCIRRRRATSGYFGMKAHIGVDSQTKRIHSVAATQRRMCMTAKSCQNCCMVKETRVWGDSAYSGQRDVIRQHAPKDKSFIRAKGTGIDYW